MISSLEERIKKVQEDIEGLSNELIEKSNADDIADFEPVLENAHKRIRKELLAIPIRKRFAAKASSLTVEKDGQVFIDLCNNTRCLFKKFNRLDYHVLSKAKWEIKLKDGEELLFTCSFNGDDEGEGAYYWSILKSGGDQQYPFEIKLNEKRKSDKELTQKLGLELKDASRFLSMMYSCSFS